MYDRTGRPVRMKETLRDLRGHDFLPDGDALLAVPGLFDQEERPTSHLMIHLHFFVGVQADWWVAEVGPSKDTPHRWDAYGFRHFGRGVPEFTRFSLTDLEAWNLGGLPGAATSTDALHTVFHRPGKRLLVERDLRWKPMPARDCVPGFRTGETGGTHA